MLHHIWLAPAVLALCTLLTGLAAAQDTSYAQYATSEMAKLPVTATPLLNGGDLASFTFAGDGDVLQHEVVSVQGQPFASAIRLKVLQATDPVYGVQLFAPPSPLPVHRGDTVLVVFNVRCTASADPSGTGTLLACLQLSREPWTQLLTLEESPGGQWQRLYGYGVAGQDFAAGDLGLAIHLGYHPQTVEFGGFLILNLGQGVDPGKLPYTPKTYAGREKDAPWREAAAERIERYRKGDLAVSVVDPTGKPVPGAQVRVRMTRHAYGFGTYVEELVLQDTPDGQKYREWVLRLFNRATAPIYWADWGWDYPDGRKRYDGIAQWLKDNGLTTRGHPIVYPAWKFLPSALRTSEKDPPALRQRILDHVADVVEATNRYGFDEYDVTNELRDLHDVTDILGFQAVVEWFQTARKHNTTARLAINENTILTNGGKTQRQQDNYAQVIEKLLAAGVGPDAIGMQGHFGAVLTPPDRLVEILDRFAKYGKPIHITEFDLDIADPDAQADYMRDFMTVIFSHPATEAFTQWGFWEGRHWRPQGAMFRKDWTIKPNGQAFMDLVFKQWWTDVTGNTASDGAYATRGFLGDYEITVSSAGRTKTTSLHLQRPGTAVKVVLD